LGIFNRRPKNEDPHPREFSKWIRHSFPLPKENAFKSVLTYELKPEAAFKVAEAIAIASALAPERSLDKIAKDVSVSRLTGTSLGIFRSSPHDFVLGSRYHYVPRSFPNSDMLKLSGHPRIRSAHLPYGNTVEISYWRDGFLQIRRGVVVKLYDDGILLRTQRGYRRYAYAKIHAVSKSYEGSAEFFREMTVTVERKMTDTILLSAPRDGEQRLKRFVAQLATHQEAKSS